MGSAVEAFLVTLAKEVLLSTHTSADTAEAEARTLLGCPGSRSVKSRPLVVSVSE
jgi:hypothetical protein